MTRKKKLAIALLASLALVASGCGSGETEVTESGGDTDTAEATTEDATEEGSGDEEEGSADDAMEDDAMEDDAMEDDAMEDDDDDAMEDDADDAMEDDADDAMEDDEAGLQDVTLGEMLQAGAPFEADALACFEDRDIDLSQSVADIGDDLMSEAELAIVVCNAQNEGALDDLLAGEELPEGIDADQAKCAWSETFAALGALPVDEALAELDLDAPSEDFRADLIPTIVDECGLDEDQVNALLDDA